MAKRTHIVGLLAWSFAAGCALQIAAAYIIEPYPLRGIVMRELAPLTGGYWSVGTRISSVGAFLADFARNVGSYPVHPQRHPPGLPLLFYFLTRIAERLPGLSASAGAWLRPLACFDSQAGNLNDAQLTAGLFGTLVESLLTFATVIPLFALVRRLSNARAAGIAVVLFVLAPGVLIWASQFDRTFAFFAITSLWLTERLVTDRKYRPLIAVALGVVLSVDTFLSFGNAPVILLCALYAAARVWQHERLTGWLARIPQAVLVAVGIASLWVIAWLAFGFDPVKTYNVTMGIHYEVQRDYWPFVFWNAWDMLTFIGLPIAALAIGLAWKRAPALAGAFAASIIILCMLNVARGETGRVWLFFAPVVIALAAISLANHRTARLGIVMILVVAQGILHIGMLRVISYGIDPLTVPDATTPATMIPTEIRYGEHGELQLLGYTYGTPEQASLTVKPDAYTGITLYWKLNSSAPITESYEVFVHVAARLDDQGVIANANSLPMNWALPTSCWRPGQIVRDAHDLAINSGAKPGDYVALVGLFDETGRRASIERAQRAMNNAVELPVKITIVAAK